MKSNYDGGNSTSAQTIIASFSQIAVNWGTVLQCCSNLSIRP
ncbi:MAG: hypothetical protein ACTMUB_04855 [cyanobacterium endosymbiont of Rhopalodia musculus]